MPRTILMFDMDGTLADTQSQLAELCVRLGVEEYGCAEDELRVEIARLLHSQPKDLISSVWRAFGQDPAELDEERIRSFIRSISAEAIRLTTLFPEVPDVLARLKAAGYTLILSSTTPEDAIEERARNAGIRRYFDLLLGSDLSRPDDPSKPKHAAMASELLGMPIEEFQKAAVFVADAPGDMEIARDAGVLGIARRTGDNGAQLLAAGASHVIRDLRELEPLLSKLD